MINLTPKSTQIIVNGLDCSSILVEGSGSISSAESKEGLMVVTAEFTLGYSPTFAESLDDRLNSRWARGGTVVVNYGGARAPVLGHTLIDSAQWDGISLLTIRTSCVLGHLNNITPAELGVCLSPLSTMGAHTAIMKMLQRAGVTSLSIPTMGGTIRRILEFTSGSSLIKLAGELAFANGYVLYQDNLGTVRCLDVTSINKTNVATISGRDCLTNDRLYDSDQPPQEVRISSADITVQNTDSLSNSNSTSGSGISYTRTITTATRDTQRRILGNTVTTFATLGKVLPALYPNSSSLTVSQILETNEDYEDLVIGFSPDATSLERCVPLDEGRLLKRETIVRAPYNVAFEAWIATARAAKNNIFGSFSIIVAEKTTETWTYNLPRTTQTEGTIVYKKQVYKTMGRLFPFTGDPTFGRGGDTKIIVSPSELVLAAEEIITSTLSRGLWSSHRIATQVNYENNPELIAAKIEDKTVVLQGILNTALGLQYIENKTETNTSSPSITRYPPVQNEVVKPFVVTTRFSGRGKRSLDLSVNPNGQGGQSRLKQLARGIGEVAWGKQKGQIVSISLDQVPVSTKPLDGIIINDADVDSYYAMDKISVAVRPKEAVLSFNGLLRGVVPHATGIEIKPIVAQIELPLIDEENWDVVVSTALMENLNIGIFENETLFANELSIVTWEGYPDWAWETNGTN